MVDKLTLSTMKNISDLAGNKDNNKNEVKRTSLNIGKSEEAILKSILLKNKSKVNLKELKNNSSNYKSQNYENINKKDNNIDNIELKSLKSLNNKASKVDIKDRPKDNCNRKMISLKDLSK